MTMTDIYRIVASKQVSWTELARSLVNRYASYRSKRLAMAQLRGLDARTLRDMAIDRSEICSLVHCDPHGRRRYYLQD